MLYFAFILLISTCSAIDDVCHLPVDNGHSCGIDPGPRFGYVASQNKCVFFEFLGCGGSVNQFRKKKECKAACVRIPQFFDLLPIVPGIVADIRCFVPIDQGYNCGEDKAPRFYYDHNQEKCVFFEYEGCGGNGNRFKTRKECAAKCLLE